MAIHTRPATRDDLPVLLSFEQGIIAFERPFDPTLKPDPISYYDIGELIDSEEAEVIVALDDTRVIGSGYAKIKSSDPYLQEPVHAFLGFMFVHPDYRGRGINKHVTDALLLWAAKMGLKEVRLRVYSDNDGAIRAYEKAGFRSHLIEMRRELTLD